MPYQNCLCLFNFIFVNHYEMPLKCTNPLCILSKGLASYDRKVLLHLQIFFFIIILYGRGFVFIASPYNQNSVVDAFNTASRCLNEFVKLITNCLNCLHILKKPSSSQFVKLTQAIKRPKRFLSWARTNYPQKLNYF